MMALWPMAEALLASLLVARTAIADTKPETGAVNLVGRWIELRTTVLGTTDVSRTHSAMYVYRGIDPASGKPIDNLVDVLGAAPEDLNRTFRLEKSTLLLGEPILLEFNVSLAGPGVWREEIYSTLQSLRYHKIFLLMRNSDGTWVRDPEGAGYGGGSGCIWKRDVTRRDAISQWFGVQRWCLVEKPGEYDLFCFQLERGHVESDHYKRTRRIAQVDDHDAAGNPLLKKIPDFVYKAAAGHFDVKRISDFTHLKLRIRQGTDREQRHMVQEYTAQALRGPEITHPNERPPNDRYSALCDAIVYARQDDFLALLTTWIAEGQDMSGQCLKGLGIRATVPAMAVLMEQGMPRVWGVLGNLHPTHRPALIPWVINWVTNEDPEVRNRAVAFLRSWTGEKFEPERTAAEKAPVLTVDDCAQIRRMAQDWWAKHKMDFTINPCGADIRRVGP